MGKLTWGVDGFGRLHICEYTSGKHLLCVIPGYSALECIAILEEQTKCQK